MDMFDFHTHAFVDSLAERAMSQLADTSDIVPCTDGTVKGLIRTMDKNNIRRAMLLPIATKPSQQRVINDWAASVMNDRLFCCGTVHPDAEDALDEIERIKELGLYGVKFHSEYQLFEPDEEKMLPIYRKIAECGLFAVFHGGWEAFSRDYIRATPERLANAAKAVPELTIIAAHLGGMKLWDDVEKFLAGKFENVYLDTGVIARAIGSGQLLRIIKTHGVDKILFASDCPWDDPANEAAMIRELPLSQEEKEMIFSKNAEHLLSLRQK